MYLINAKSRKVKKLVYRLGIPNRIYKHSAFNIFILLSYKNMSMKKNMLNVRNKFLLKYSLKRAGVNYAICEI